MIWAILALLGVPLWLCAAGILVVVLNKQKRLHRLEEGFTTATLATASGDTLVVATSSEQSSALLGPFEARAPGSQ